MPSPFDEFLSWLSPDREMAAIRYEELRKILDRLFAWGGCHIPGELFDETIERASAKIASGAVARSVDPIRYCIGIARNVLREYRRLPKPDSVTGDHSASVVGPEWDERKLACLDKCLEQLREHDRELVTRYYQAKGSEKIRGHKEMAANEGGTNTLRLRIFRIKNTLRDCVSACLAQDSGSRKQ